MRYENPLHFSEAAAAIDHIADGRIPVPAGLMSKAADEICTTDAPQAIRGSRKPLADQGFSLAVTVGFETFSAPMRA